MSKGVIRGLKKLSKPVKPADKRSAINNPVPKKVEGSKPKTVRHTKAPGALKVEEIETEDHGSFDPNVEYVEVEVESSRGKRYKIVIPKSYVRGVPKKWKWDAEKYRVAELIAMGVPISQIPDDPQVIIKSRMIIYCWLQHPEFKEHVDGITLETGWANKRERISGLNRLNRILFDKIVNELDRIDITDKSIGAILTSIQTTAKLIAQEKEEFVEESKITADTTITGSMTNVNVETKLEELLQSKSDVERKELEKEFDNMGDDIIRALTGKDN